ncbi:MAG: LysM peptidoglycan-binding domain-containing protein [Chlamydiales bacterium]|nr:LysM peptidoglycan-binding domain-containing protein [Chlamydiales bacterium]
MKRLALISCVALSSCSSRMTSWQEERSPADVALEEVRIELSDLRHELSGTRVDLQILDEKIKQQKTPVKGAESSLQLSTLDRKLAELQKSQEKLAQDLRQLGTHANQASTTFAKQQEKLHDLEQEIQAQNRRLDEIVKLKGTLSSLSEVLKEKSREESSNTHTYRKYKVKSGDSLEKIAKQQHTTIEAIKKLNDLSSDRIVVGQEIKLPHD